MDRSVTMRVLQRYCRDNKIPVRAAANRATLEAAIARFLYASRKEIRPDTEIGCFGYWAADESNCMTCSFKVQCAKVSLGDEPAKYKTFIDRLENPRFSFDDKAIKTRKKAKKG